MTELPRNKYQYDVALSYAGENEKLVRQIHGHLKAANVKVFFAPTRTADLWGKDEREFQHIFGPASRFVVPFVSEDYVQKEWPRLEFRAARREAPNREGEFILPVRIDATKLPGLRERMQYIDARRYSPRQIARFLIDNKLSARRSRTAAVVVERAHRGKVQILTPSDAELLGLIATAFYPLRINDLKSLLPKTNWTAEIHRWRRRGFLRQGSRHLEVTPTVGGLLRRRPGGEQKCHEQWIEALTPLKTFCDTALMLALHYASLRRIHEMLQILTPIATSLDPGFWNDLYLKVFERFEGTPHINRTSVVSAKWLVLLDLDSLGLTPRINGRIHPVISPTPH